MTTKGLIAELMRVAVDALCIFTENEMLYVMCWAVLLGLAINRTIIQMDH